MFFQMFILHGSPLQTALVQTLRTLNSNGLRIKPWVLGALGTAKMWRSPTGRPCRESWGSYARHRHRSATEDTKASCLAQAATPSVSMQTSAPVGLGVGSRAGVSHRSGSRRRNNGSRSSSRSSSSTSSRSRTSSSSSPTSSSSSSRRRRRRRRGSITSSRRNSSSSSSSSSIAVPLGDCNTTTRPLGTRTIKASPQEGNTIAALLGLLAAAGEVDFTIGDT